MEWLNTLVTTLGPAYVVIGLLMVLIIQAFFIAWSVKQRTIFREKWQDVNEEIEAKKIDREKFFISTQARVTKLEQQLADKSGRSYVDRFDTDQLYTLVAKAGIKTKKARYYYGLVRYGKSALVPFMVPRSEAEGLEELHSGDQFSVFSNRLAGVIPFQENRKVSNSSNPVIPFPQKKVKPKTSDGVEDYFESLPYLKAISGADKGAIYYLPFTNCTIGRDKSNQILLSDDAVQPIHAKLQYDQNYFIIEGPDNQDLIHNDQTIKKKRLYFGDIVTLGNTRLEFSCKGYEFRDEDPEFAIDMLKRCIEREPNFIVGLKNLAFLLERDIRYKKESAPLWKRLGKLEKRAEQK